MASPLVSIIMPVYNAGVFLCDAIDSMLQQTYSNWELILIDDGSTDDSWEILLRYGQKDARIKLYQNETNQGVAKSLNKALELVSGDFVARMDADDISHPQRLERQVEFLQEHPEIDLISADTITFKTHKPDILPIVQLNLRYPPAIAKTLLVMTNVFSHPTVMARMTERMRPLFYYDEAFELAEDYHLWIRLAMGGFQLATVKEALVFYRLTGKNVSVIDSPLKAKKHVALRQNIHRCWLDQLGIAYSPIELQAWTIWGMFNSLSRPDLLDNFLKKLTQQASEEVLVPLLRDLFERGRT